jgi:hypothetical protein
MINRYPCNELSLISDCGIGCLERTIKTTMFRLATYDKESVPREGTSQEEENVEQNEEQEKFQKEI